MNLDLKNKRVLVTGSTRGIGLEIAKCFLEAGCYVGINSRDKSYIKDLLKTFNNDKLLECAGDVTNPKEADNIVKSFVDSLNGIDILVCNVGSGKSRNLGEEDFDEWNRMLALNLLSSTNMIERCKEKLSESKGSVVCISSICGCEVVPGAPIAYSASKAALNSFVKSSSRPFGKLGIRINAVAPGNIMFPGSVWEGKIKDDENAVNKMLEKEVALEKLGSPLEIANLVLFLSSSLSSNITGQIYVNDGGQIRG